MTHPCKCRGRDYCSEAQLGPEYHCRFAGEPKQACSCTGMCRKQDATQPGIECRVERDANALLEIVEARIAAGHFEMRQDMAELAAAMTELTEAAGRYLALTANNYAENEEFEAAREANVKALAILVNVTRRYKLQRAVEAFVDATTPATM